MNKPPWQIGSQVEFVTFDHELTRMSELDGTYGTVIECDEHDAVIGSEYGIIECDAYDVRPVGSRF